MLPLLVSVLDRDSGASARQSFARSPVRVGRNDLNDLVLDRAAVSQWHASLEFDEETAHYTDLGSTNGTRAGGQRLQANEPRALEPGLVLEIGALQLTFERTRDGSAESTNVLPGTGAPIGMTEVVGTYAAPRADAHVARAPPANPAPTPLAGRAPMPAPTLPASPPVLPPAPAAGIHAGALSPSVPPWLPRPAAPPATDTRFAATEVGGVDATGRGASAAMPTEVVGNGRRSRLADLAPATALAARLAPVYQAYQGAAAALDAAVAQHLAAQDPAAAAMAFVVLEGSFPALAERPAIRALAAAHGVRLEGEAAVAARVLHDVLMLDAGLRGGAPRAPTNDDTDALLGQLARVLHAFGAAFVALRRSQDELAQEVPLPSRRDLPPELDRPTLPQHALGYLFGDASATPARLEELRRAFAEIMVHQVGMLGALMQGLRLLLERLSPEAIARDGATLPVPTGLLGRLRAWRENRPAALWQRYVRCHAQLADDKGQLRDAVLGPGVARAYSAMTRGRPAVK